MYRHILGMRVDVTTSDYVLNKIQTWSSDSKGYYICVSNVHMCMECFDNREFQFIVNAADLIVPDGRPLVWAEKLLGANLAHQVRGMDLVLKICESAVHRGLKIGFYGSTPEALGKLQNVLREKNKEIDIRCLISPPFRALTKEEDNIYVNKIIDSGVQVLFVGIGCPKQEYWMAAHRDQLNCVMVGVGAAFDFIAGQKCHAPRWIQSIGFEWLFRLFSEPCRLWKRYLKHNPRFIFYFLCQLLGKKYD